MTLVLLSVFVLSGCASAYTEKISGVPEADQITGTFRSQEDEDSPALTPVIAWSADGSQLVLTTYGSSSCPAEPRSVRVTQKSVVEIEVARSNWMCTADYGPTTFWIDVPAGLSEFQQADVVLNRETTLRLSGGR
ncbi:hypothetical protein [Microbacterium arborescens]|uniref:hypothetical protein n=1 Tax=Microbacterium arborescens TaxID=33883 RepID=UPI0025A07ED9|nr:hypothetical protein [Microbacterium arborescens]WJM17164.1 hypothetical protein QUC20_07660 [Microbacterium arborescens]